MRRNRSIEISAYGGPEVLRLVERETPTPGPGEVRIRVEAAGVSFADVLMREGMYPRWSYVPAVPFTPGWDVVGRVDAVGEGVSAALEGERVAALPKVGGYTDAVCAAEQTVVPVPEGVDAAEAVSLVLNYVTAYQLLHRVARVKAGERILVDGAAGGVGSAVLELARVAGLEVAGTASSAKHAFVRERGAIPIDYRQENVTDALRRIFGGPVDVALDGVGGWHLLDTLRAVHRGGRIVSFGISSFSSPGGRRGWLRLRGYSGFAAAFALGFLERKRISTYSIADAIDHHPTWFRQDLSLLFDLLASGEIHPAIRARLPLARAAAAHELLGGSGVCGRVVLICGNEMREQAAGAD